MSTQITLSGVFYCGLVLIWPWAGNYFSERSIIIHLPQVLFWSIPSCLFSSRINDMQFFFQFTFRISAPKPVCSASLSEVDGDINKLDIRNLLLETLLNWNMKLSALFHIYHHLQKACCAERVYCIWNFLPWYSYITITCSDEFVVTLYACWLVLLSLISVEGCRSLHE